MKIKQCLLSLFFGIILYVNAQPPANYYNSAIGQSGAALKTALYNIIKNHNTQTYSSIWTHFRTTDKKSNGSVWDIYSNNNYTFGTNQCGNYSAEGDCYNREHSWPKSWFKNATPMYSDLFHIYPSDGYVNGRRGNLAFGNVSSPTYTSGNRSKIGPNSYPGYTGTVFEPTDEYKGDLARTYFYMVTRYENIVSSWQSNDNDADATLNGTSYPAFETWALNLLYSWHIQDPVSQKEIDRNNAIYGIQNNRNPYIDHPEWVALVWGFATVTCSGIPSSSASNTTITSASISSANISWTNGNGIKRIVAIVPGQNINFIPTGSLSGVNSNFALASDQGSGIKVVYDGTGSAVAISGLSSLTGYTVKVYEYCPASLQYNNGSSSFSFSTTGLGGGAPASGNTLLGESFTTCPAPGWTTYSISSNKNWTCATFSGNIYMGANGFGGDVASNDWLISPLLNLSSVSGATLTFNSKTRFADSGISGPELTVLYSTNYSGSGDPTASTWTSLSGYALSAEASSVFTNSGPVNIPSNSAATYIAFKYVSSGTASGSAADWQVDDVSVVVVPGTTTGSVNTCTAPNMQTSNLMVSSVTSGTIRLTWTNGNGNGRIVVAREGAPVSLVPSVQYFGINSDFQLSEDEGDGNKIVYSGTGNTVEVTNLSAQTTYYFHAFEYCTPGYSYNTALQTTSGITIVPAATVSGRLDTITSESFNICPASGWTTYSVSSNKNWYCGTTSGGLKFMAVNGFGGDVASNDWLISPVLDLSSTTGNILQFRSWTRYKDVSISGSEVTIKYSTNYSGSGDPTLATWTNLSGATMSSENSQVWAFSGDVSLPSTSATTYVAFQYQSSGTVSDAAAFWEIDDVIVLGLQSMATTASGANFITAFSITGMIGSTISGNNITVLMPFGTNLASLSPSVSISALATLNPALGTSRDFSTTQSYTVTSQSLASNVYNVSVTNAPAPLSTANEITNFSITGMIGSTISGNNITVLMPFGTNLASLSPSVSISALATLNPALGTSRDFSTTQSYTVTSQSLTTNVYNVSIHVLPPATVPSTLCAMPSKASSSVTITKVYPDRINISWVAGNGNGRILIAKKDSATSWLPTTGTYAGINNNFDIATDQGGGHKILYESYTANLNSITITGLSAETKYYFTLVEFCLPDYVYNTSELTTFTGTTSQVFTTSSGINRFENGLKIYPNPSGDRITIQDLQRMVRITVTNIDGQVLVSKEIDHSVYTLNTEALPNGIYMLQIQYHDGRVAVHKIGILK